MRISSRPETPQDEPFLRRLITEAVTEQLGAEGWPEALRGQILSVQCQARRQGVRSRFPDGKSRIILADGAEAGWLYLAELPDELHLVEIIVLAEHRGRGVGTAVLREVIEAASRKAQPVRLSVDVMNTRAIALYERAGFRRIGGDAVQHIMERQDTRALPRRGGSLHL